METDSDVEMALVFLQTGLEQPQSRFLRMSIDVTRIDEAITEGNFEGADTLLRELLVTEYYTDESGPLDLELETLISSQTMFRAAERGDKEVMRLLVKVCLRRTPEKIVELINGEDSSCNETVLLWASEMGNLEEMARLLLEANLPIPHTSPRWSSSGKKYTTPLHLAIKPFGVSEGEVPDNLLQRAELAKRFLQSPLGKEMLNKRDLQGNTPLHLAVETMNFSVVEALIEERSLLGTVENDKRKTPDGLNREQAHSNATRELEAVRVINNFLSKLHDVQEERNVLIQEKKRYSRAAMHFLVIGALLVQVSFPGILSMVTLPQELLTDLCPDSPPPAVSTVQSCLQDEAHLKRLLKYKPYYVRAIDIFRGSNNLSFYFAIVTIMAAIRLIVSSSRNIPHEKEISHMKHMNIVISLALTLSTTFMVMAFVSGGLAKIPVVESGWAYVLSEWVDGRSIAILKSTMLTTNSVGLVLSSPFIFIFLYDNLIIFRVYLGSKFGSWSGHHGRWPDSRWQRLLIRLLAILFFLATLFSVCMLIFGVGLLKDYIKPPPTT